MRRRRVVEEAMVYGGRYKSESRQRGVAIRHFDFKNQEAIITNTK
jgi:hypothetical protein